MDALSATAADALTSAAVPPPAGEATSVIDILSAEKGGLARNLAPDPAGIRTVLELRSKFGAPKKTLTDPMKYVDLTYYEKASAKK